MSAAVKVPHMQREHFLCLLEFESFPLVNCCKVFNVKSLKLKLEIGTDSDCDCAKTLCDMNESK